MHRYAHPDVIVYIVNNSETRMMHDEMHGVTEPLKNLAPMVPTGRMYQRRSRSTPTPASRSCPDRP